MSQLTTSTTGPSLIGVTDATDGLVDSTELKVVNTSPVKIHVIPKPSRLKVSLMAILGDDNVQVVLSMVLFVVGSILTGLAIRWMGFFVTAPFVIGVVMSGMVVTIGVTLALAVLVHIVTGALDAIDSGYDKAFQKEERRLAAKYKAE
jgi:hypothetical protein